MSCNSRVFAPEKTPEDLALGKFVDDATYEVYNQGAQSSLYRLWIPDGVQPRAVLALSRGGGASGLEMVELPEWRDYARKEGLALLGTYTRTSTEAGAHNLLVALHEMAEEYNIPELNSAPILLRGFSSGGRFSHDFAHFQPERTLAFANLMGTVNEVDMIMPPGLFIIGAKDLESRNVAIKNVFLKQRSLNAIACLSIDRLAAHGVEQNDDLVRSFFSAILSEKLSTSPPKQLQITTMPLGNNELKEVYAYTDYPYEIETASALINDAFKILWQEFEQR